MKESSGRWIVVGIIVPIVIAVISSPFWMGKLFPDSPVAVAPTSPPPDPPATTTQPTDTPPPDTQPATTAQGRSTSPFPGPATIYLNTDSGPVGTIVLVSGNGFQQGETVDLRFHTTDCARTTADASGKFSQVPCTVPAAYADSPDTDFDIVATGRSSIQSDRKQFHLT